MGKPNDRKGVAAAASVQNFDFDNLQLQLFELSEQDNGIMAMIDLINETKKSKLAPEDRTIVNIAWLITPFLMTNQVMEASVKKLKVTVDKNKVNLRQLAYHNEKLEQYTRRDNLRLFNFLLCDDADLRAKFIDMAALLEVVLQTYDINIIHKLASNARSQTAIVRMNNRKLRNDILFAKKAFTP